MFAWYIAINRSKGDKRYNGIFPRMVLNILLLMAVLSSYRYSATWRRSDAIGKVAYLLFVIIPLTTETEVKKIQTNKSRVDQAKRIHHFSKAAGGSTAFDPPYPVV